MSLLVAALALVPLEVYIGHPQGPAVTAASALVADAETGRILWGKNVDVRRYPASTTKILTGLILAEESKPEDVIIAPPGVEEVEPSSMHLVPGESLSAQDMLQALMLRSANDGAEAIAVHLAGSVEKFSAKMNQRAKEIGCTDTTFFNPHGLNHPDHLTTARDMARIALAAMNNDWFRQVVRNPKHTLTRDLNPADLLVVNKNDLLEKDPSTQGIKTGYTRPAGRCFVGYNDRDGRPLVTVVFKSEDWRIDHQNLVEWAFAHYQKRPVLASPFALPPALVDKGVEPQVSLKTNDIPVALVSDYDLENIKIQTDAPQPLPAPVAKDAPIGEGKLILPEGDPLSIPLQAAAAVDKRPEPFGPTGLIILAAVSGMTYWMKSRARKPRRRR